MEVEYIKKPKGFRKEDRIREIVAKRGGHPGLVHVFSVMELCSSYRPWHNKQTGMNYLRPDGGKCVHYYFYFIDESARPVLSERSDLVSVPGSVLLQRP